MGVYLNPDDLPSWARGSGVDVDWAIDAVESMARQVAPCLFPVNPELVRDVQAILLAPAAQMAATRGGLVTRQASGPFSIEFREGVGASLSAAAESALAALCGDAPAAVVQWTFPPGGDYSPLFASPRGRL